MASLLCRLRLRARLRPAGGGCCAALRIACASLLVLAARTTADTWFPPIPSADEARKETEDREGRVRSGAATPEDYYRLGVLYFLHTPSTSLANVYLRRAVQLDPGNPMAAFLYSMVLERRGDYASALDPLLAIAAQETEPPIRELAVRTIRSYLGNTNDFTARVEPAFRRLLRRPGSQPLLTVRLAREVLADLYERTGRHDQYVRARREMGEVGAWRVTGSFGRHGHLDLHRAFPPEADEAFRPTYEWEGEEVRTRDEDFTGDWVRPVGKDLRPGTFYAAARFWLPLSQEVIFHLDCADPLILAIDGRTALLRDSTRNWVREEQSFRLALEEGWHGLVVKACSGSVPAGFRLCVTDASSRALEDFKGPAAVRKTEPPPSPEAWRTEALADTAERFCDAILAERHGDPWAHFVKAWLASEAGNGVEARLHQEMATAALPDFAEFHFYLARYLNDDDSLSKEEASSRARQEYQRAADLADEFAAALDEVSDFDITENHSREAIRSIQRCTRINPHYWGYGLTLFLAYRGRGWENLATEALDRALSLHPEAEQALKHGRDWFEARHDFARADDCERRLQEVLAQEGHRAGHLEDLGRTREAIREYQRLVRQRPRETRFRSALADLYLREGMWEEARSELHGLLAFDPNPEAVYKDLARLFFRSGRPEEGRAALKKALEERPADRELREVLILLGEKDEFEEFRIPLEEVLKARGDGAPPPGISTVYLLDQFVTRVFPDGSSLDLTHIIAKVLDKDGVERLGEISVPDGARLYELRVVKPNGETFEPEIHHPKESYTMSGLAPGDIVEFEHLAASEQPEIPNGYSGANFTFNSLEVPTERAQLVILTDPGYPLRFHFQNGGIEPQIEKRQGLDIYRWEMRNPVAVHREPKSVPYQEYIPYLQFSGGLTWEAVRRQHEDRLMGLLRVSPEMGAALREALHDVTDDPERAKRIFRLVEDRVKNPGGTTFLGHPAHLIFSERAGNPLVLLKALYDEAGLTTDVVFAYSQALALPVMDVPNSGTFPFGLLRLRLPGRPEIWIEPVRSGVPFGYISPAFGGTRGLLVLGQGEAFVEIPHRPPEQDRISTVLSGRVSSEGDLDAQVETEYTGFSAGSIRVMVENFSYQQWLQRIERNLSEAVRGASASDMTLENPDDPEKPVVIRYRFKASRFARREGNSLRVTQFLGTHNLVQRFAALPGRRIPLLIPSPLNTRMETRLSFPEGSTLTHRPPDLVAESIFARFESVGQEEGAMVRLVRSLVMPIQRVTPQDYPAFAQFCQQVERNEVTDIVVIVPE
ncbi:MAG: DUF3857 domain-containing protein [Planctomycetes bacterium]|nr:DUF3857 domain-containing protein [Planctomycetota bacterium]